MHPTARHRSDAPIRAGLARALAALVAPALLATACAAGVSDEGEEINSSDELPPTTTPAEDGDEGDDPDAEPTGESDDPADDAAGALLLIMDASGSMNATDANGQTLLDGAKQALHDVVAALPDGTHAGLRVYGHRVPNTDRENGCADTELVHPVSELDRDAMLAAIDGFEATGFTPIGASLSAALDDLPPEGPRTVILVSDGEDTCAPPDPCEVAEQVRAEGVELTIHTVGFALGDDGGARAELECIAEAGGGEFRDAPSAADLTEVLTEVSTRDARVYETQGTELAGAPIPRDAPTGQVDTAHTDEVLAGETNFYRFEIEPGSEVRGEMILVGNAALADEWTSLCPTVWLTDEAGEDYANGEFGGGDPIETYVKHTDSVVVDDGEVWLSVQSDNCRGASGTSTAALDLEIQLTVLDEG
jgi:hypothetical protein